MEDDICGQIIAGNIGKIQIRQKQGKKIELGDLLIMKDEEGHIILQVYDLSYGSLISYSSREQISGLNLEGYGGKLDFIDPELRNYIIADAKAVLRISDTIDMTKMLPQFFGNVRHIEKKDLMFLTEKKECPLHLGNIRSGSKKIDVQIILDAIEVLPHHMLVCSTTGRGKSNLIKNMLWEIMEYKKVGILVLDSHDEYFGRDGIGLNAHPRASSNIIYYSVNSYPGHPTLIINLKSLRPEHFEGIVDFTDPQLRIINDYISEYNEDWIESIINELPIPGVNMNQIAISLSVIQRKFRSSLSVFSNQNGVIECRNRVFSTTAGESTINDIRTNLENCNIVIIDTSRIGDIAELLIGSIVSHEIFTLHQNNKSDGRLHLSPPIGIVIEEAPRVLSKEKISKMGENIYSIIAKEGRKFKVGLVAITQIASVIPNEILSNINTKIVLGIEMVNERRVIMQSSSQDLSDEDRSIASLNKGEAIVTSVFTKFAIPIKVPLFDEKVKEISKIKSRKTLVYEE